MLSQLANGGQNTDDLADEMGISSMSRQELIMLCSAQREEVVSIRDQNDELWSKMAELETTLEMAKAQVHPHTAPLQPPHNPLLLTTFYFTFCLPPTAYLLPGGHRGGQGQAGGYGGAARADGHLRQQPTGT